MKPRGNISTRTLIIVAVLGAFVLVGVTAGVGWFMVRSISSRVRAMIERPKELERAGVLVGGGLLVKESLLRLEDPDVHGEITVSGLGDITDIVRGQFDGKPGLEIGIVGRRGAVFVDDNGRVKSAVGFDGGTQRAQMIDVNADGLCEFIGGIPPRMLDHTGTTTWTYRSEAKWAPAAGTFAIDMCGGDVDGDGRMEFAVAFIGFAGVHLLDDTGNMIWRKRATNVSHVEMVDTNGDGRDEILHTSGGGVLKIRNGRGKVIGQVRGRRYFPPFDFFMHFSLCPWPSKSSPKRILRTGKDKIRLLDFGGKVVAEFRAPHCGILGEARGTPVRLRAGQPAHLAVLVSFSIWDRSILYLYKPDGTLVYQEVFLGTCEAIAAVPLEESNREAILVGGQERVWKYRLSRSAS